VRRILAGNRAWLHFGRFTAWSMTDSVKLPRRKSDSSRYKRAVRIMAVVVDMQSYLVLELAPVDGDDNGDSSFNTCLLVPALVIVVLSRHREEW
jgi:hypothetical protein